MESAPVTREGDCFLRLGPVPERRASGVPPGTEVVTGTVFLHPLLPSLGQHFCSSISRGEPPLPGGHLSSPGPLQASSHSGNSAQLPSHKSRDRASGPRDHSYPSGRARNSPGQPTQPASRGSSRDSALKGRCTRPTPVILVSGGVGTGKTYWGPRRAQSCHLQAWSTFLLGSGRRKNRGGALRSAAALWTYAVLATLNPVFPALRIYKVVGL